MKPRLQRAEERKELVTLILKYEHLSQTTDSKKAQHQALTEMRDTALMYHRIVGDWYRR